VLRLVVRGDANKEVALKLAIHEGSVERHLTSVMRKSRCGSRSAVIAAVFTRL
jgi:DNA-binding NarL/FixJ family response regulator